jgi:hypothetical protein
MTNLLREIETNQVPHYPAPTGKPLKPPVAESIGHQHFGAESTAPVSSRKPLTT